MQFPRPVKSAFVGAAVVSVMGLGAGITALPAGAATSPIAQRYASDHALAQKLGAPTGAEFSVAGGSERDYKWGSLYYSPSTGVHEVHGAIWWKYKSVGGPAKFGFPTADETQVINNIHGEYINYGAENHFTSGEIYWNNQNNKTVWMDVAVAKLWNDQSFPEFGLPMGDETSHNGYKQVSFSDETDVYVTSKGAFKVVGGDALIQSLNTNREYKVTGGAAGYLGLPTANSTGDGSVGVTQTFNGGAIYNMPYQAGSHAVHGAIYWAYTHNGNAAKLGFPTADEAAAPGGRVSTFEHGTITWNATTNQTKVTVS